MMRRPAATVLPGLILALGVSGYGLYWEPKVALRRDDVALLPQGPRLTIAHLSDLHVREETPNLRRLVAEVAAARPDLILISGDLIGGAPDPAVLSRHLRTARVFYSALRRTAPILAVQGHSEYQGEAVTALAEAGIEWLSNEGRLIGADAADAAGNADATGRGVLLLGLSQQVGIDLQGKSWGAPFRAGTVDGRPVYAARHGSPFVNFYSHYDPTPQSSQSPRGLADASGPLSWSAYDLTVETRIENEDVGSGIEVHSRHVLGEDRMIRLRRIRAEGAEEAEGGAAGSFELVLHGSRWTGPAKTDTRVAVRPGAWYRLRLRTEVDAQAVRAFARVWPAGEAEPEQWQAWGEDRSRFRVQAGTVGLWAWGGGSVFYRNMRVVDGAGRVLLAAPLAGEPEGFRQGARGTRLELALARSPAVPPDTPRLVLSHVPDVAMEASRRGIEAVLAGHTHGGQVRLPVLGALITRSELGPFFGRGVFEFAAPNRQGWTALYVNPGVGTSLLPVRFLCPPTWALVKIGQ